jgi:hypothetical protein
LRHHRLFAAGLAAALMLGAAAPAMAASKGKKPPPATKGKKSGVSGGGAVAGGAFSIQARPKSKAKGHFNYTSTDGTFKVRCKAFDTFTPDLAAKTASVPFKNCTITGHPTVKTLTVNVVDRGNPPDEGTQPSTPVVRDTISFDVGRSYGGNLVDGNIKVR